MTRSTAATIAAPQLLLDPIAEMLVSLARDLLRDAHPVSVQTLSCDDGTCFLLQVPPEALGTLLGPRGRTIASLRVILRAAGIKHGSLFSLTIEPNAEPSPLEIN